MTTVDEMKSTNPRTNPLAMCSVVAGVLALASMVGLGAPVPAAFAVGAGHVALHQIERRGGRGRRMSLAGLIVGYVVAVWALALTLVNLMGLLTSG